MHSDGKFLIETQREKEKQAYTTMSRGCSSSGGSGDGGGCSDGAGRRKAQLYIS